MKKSIKSLALVVLFALSLALSACENGAQNVVSDVGDNPVGQAGQWCHEHCPK